MNKYDLHALTGSLFTSENICIPSSHRVTDFRVLYKATRLLALYKSKTSMFRHIFAVFAPQVQIELEFQSLNNVKRENKPCRV